jgi:hypothetical protein
LYYLIYLCHTVRRNAHVATNASLALYSLTKATCACDTHAVDATEHKAFFAVAAALAPVTSCTQLPTSNAVNGAVTGPQQPPAYTAKQITLLRKLSTALNIAPQLTSVLFADKSSSTEVTDTSATVKSETIETETVAAAVVTESNGTETASIEAAAIEAAGSSSSDSSGSSNYASNKRKADEISTSTDSNSSNSSSSNSSKAILSNGDLTQVAKLLRKQLPSISLSE